LIEAADHHPVADRQMLAQGGEHLIDPVGYVDTLCIVLNIGLYGDGGLPVALPNHTVFESIRKSSERR
jgi:hypothetical protein